MSPPELHIGQMTNFSGPLFSELCNKPEDVLPAQVNPNAILSNVNLVIDLLADNKEGTKSFLEKRLAQFSGTIENSAPAAYLRWMPIDIVRRTKADKSGAKAQALKGLARKVRRLLDRHSSDINQKFDCIIIKFFQAKYS